MGAANFYTVALGKTPQEAFNDAHERASWEHGHGGYTGTIAEKGSFTLFEVPARLSIDKLINWVEQFDYAGDTTYLKEDLTRQIQWAANAKPGTKRAAQARVTEAKKRLKAGEKEAAKFKREVGQHYDLVRRMSQIYDDKWGPALAIEVKSPTKKKKYIDDWTSWNPSKVKRGTRVFIFCGYASS